MTSKNYRFRSFFRKEYFSQISKSDVRELHKLYRWDHQLFGYGIQPFLSLGN